MIEASHDVLGRYELHCEERRRPFSSPKTNLTSNVLWGVPNRSPFREGLYQRRG